jgi:hypothetical protein
MLSLFFQLGGEIRVALKVSSVFFISSNVLFPVFLEFPIGVKIWRF